MTGERTTGNDKIEGVDPGGTHSTRPGNPDKSGAPRPGAVTQDVVSGDRNGDKPEAFSNDAPTEPRAT